MQGFFWTFFTFFAILGVFGGFSLFLAQKSGLLPPFLVLN
jgi:hypothetical protein